MRFNRPETTGGVRVALLCEYPSLNGGERSMLATLSPLQERGFEFVAITPETGPLADAFDRLGIERVSFRAHDQGGRRRSLEEIRGHLAARFRRVRPDLVHANSLSMCRIGGPVAAELALPSIGHIRDIVNLSHAARADVNTMNLVLAVSAATLHWHVERGLDERRALILHNGVDLVEFRPRPRSGALHRELGLDGGTELVLSIGQVGVRKGLDILFDAACVVVESCPGVHFVVVGERFSGKQEAIDYERSLCDRAAKPPLFGRCHFLGWRDDVPELLRDAAVLAHPARQEPLGRVLLEAAAAGVPVAATRVGGTEEIFPPESETATLIPVNDAAALAAALVELITDPARRAARSLAGRRRVEQAFSIGRAVEGLERCYHSILARR